MIDGEWVEGICNEDFIGDGGWDGVVKFYDDVWEIKEDIVGIWFKFKLVYGLVG